MAAWACLDCFLISLEILSWFPNLVQRGLNRSLSDHNVVTIGGEKVEWGPSPFSFVNSWLQLRDLMNEALMVWKETKKEGTTRVSLAAKVKASKCRVKNWIKENKKKCSRTKLFEKGLAVVDKMARRDSYGSLFNQGRVWSFFKNHFKKEKWCRPKIRRLNFLQISAMDNSMLERRFTIEVVWAAISGYDGNKAPSPNGFNLNFFKANWEVIQGDFMKFLNEFYGNGSLVKDVNHSFITLIPKCAHSETLMDFRPISLVGSMYKILGKVLANRLKKVMNMVIGENQMAFAQKHQIMDSFVIAKEIIHS
ncbi:hypothetical protein Ddye_001466 [Dipteronia dyeriana]|uniref:Reverse transcriptase domain-containing protein n=1 Tax=Dipteronia dyeriana TaxID=168575 RepID=A0AAE0CTH7_9ROSI|nr:hypothetical protein Ddye_001466 [Dipteronia dyeriana]